MARKSKKIIKGQKHRVHFHLKWTSAFFIFYLLLSLVYSPDFLLSDVRGKFKALADDAITITATVLASPVKPIISATAVCDNGNLFVLLDWADDVNSQYFSITRNSLPLVTGLSVSQFKDQNVLIATAYDYQVTATGPMGPGFAISDIVNVATPPVCAAIAPPPAVVITSFDNGPTIPWNAENETVMKRPIFSGTVNIPNAWIDIIVNSNQVVTAHIQADNSGFWSWIPPVDLEDGEHNIMITATDPLDFSRVFTTRLYFVIEENDRDDEEATEKKEDQERAEEKKIVQNKQPIVPIIINPAKPSSPLTSSGPLQIPEQGIFDFSLDLQSSLVTQGDNLGAKLKINDISQQYSGKNAKLSYIIYNEKYEEIARISQEVVISKGGEFSKNIPISKYLTRGRYYLEAQISTPESIFTQRKSFEVQDMPILNLGGGFVLTYPTLLSMMGTASILLLLIVLLWLFLFSREYWLYLHALRHITERNLQKMGFFGPRKRKGVPN